MKEKVGRPLSVKVGPYEFEIRWVANSEMEDNGMCDRTYLYIKVKDDLPSVQQRVTVFHEMMHAAAAVIDGRKEEERSEEDWCRYTAGLLFDALNSNHDLREWMFGS